MTSRSFLAFVLALIAAQTETAADGSCNTAVGRELFVNGNWSAAFADLKACETVPGIDSETLGILAMLYGQLEELQSDESGSKRSYELFVRSAALGNADALSVLASLFLEGTPEIGVPKSRAAYDCFSELAEKAQGKETDVSYEVQCCLSRRD